MEQVITCYNVPSDKQVPVMSKRYCAIRILSTVCKFLFM